MNTETSDSFVVAKYVQLLTPLARSPTYRLPCAMAFVHISTYTA